MQSKFVALSTLVLAGASGPTYADRLPMPSDMSPAYRAECGACHIPFPPALLAPKDWIRVMEQLDRHYGVDASLDETTRQHLRSFLERHGNPKRPAAPDAQGLPRLTETTWFRRKHDEVPPRLWQDVRVKSRANCAACHRDAESGDFSEHRLRMPGLR
ncbi:MAG: diheme cytochrome c [Thiobacillaceae bacterium]